MKLIRIIQVLVLALILNISAKGQEKLEKTAQGMEYKIYTSNFGDKLKVNDIITFNFIQKTDKDSVLMSSYDIGRPVKIQIQPSKNVADLMDFFTLLTVKDSAMVKVPTDSIFKNSEESRPPFFPKGSSLVFLIKIEKVQTLDEVMAEEKEEMEKLQAAEKATVAKYIVDEKLTPKVTSSGLQYVITKTSTKEKPNSGDSVFVNYTGRTIDGKVFDSSIEAEAKKAGLEQPGREYGPISFVVGKGEVIRGWDEGLLLLNEGSKAKFIIPSNLAYGPEGAGEHIKPFSSLIFDVELVKVKPAKVAATPKAPSKTPSKTPAKAKPKTPAKAPAKAPAKTTPVKKTGTAVKKPVS